MVDLFLRELFIVTNVPGPAGDTDVYCRAPNRVHDFIKTARQVLADKVNSRAWTVSTGIRVLGTVLFPEQWNAGVDDIMGTMREYFNNQSDSVEGIHIPLALRR